MKKITLLLILIPVLGVSQIKKIETTKPELIGKIGPLGETWVKIE